MAATHFVYRKLGEFDDKYKESITIRGEALINWLVRRTSVRADRDSSPGQGQSVVCSWARHFTFPVLSSTEEYKWVLTNCLTKMLWGGYLSAVYYSTISHPGREAILLGFFMLISDLAYRQTNYLCTPECSDLKGKASNAEV